jgi:hypothetical protein
MAATPRPLNSDSRPYCACSAPGLRRNSSVLPFCIADRASGGKHTIFFDWGAGDYGALPVVSRSALLWRQPTQVDASSSGSTGNVRAS